MLGMSTGSILRALVGRVLVPLAFLVIAAALAGGAQAQAPGDKSAKPQTTLAEPATREAVQELISELDDQQIRALAILIREAVHFDQKKKSVNWDANSIFEVASASY